MSDVYETATQCECEGECEIKCTKGCTPEKPEDEVNVDNDLQNDPALAYGEDA